MNVQVEIPQDSIEQIARNVCEEMLAKATPIHDAQAEEIARTIQRINAKQFITINEFSVLFNCSRGYVDTLLEKAQDRTNKHPVPFLNLDGLIQFDRLAVIEWAREAKTIRKNQRKQGGKREFPKAVNQ